MGAFSVGTAKWRKENADHIRAYKREWYKQNRSRVVNDISERKRQLASWLQAYKATLKCSRCGEDHPACLDFHHRIPSDKEFTAAWMAKWGWSIAKMQAEIKKCDVLCANCHRKLHWSERTGEDI